MSSLDVAIKPTDPVRVVATSAVASGFGHENLGPIFGRLVPKLLVHLGSSNTRPGIMISWYEDPSDDGSVVLHAGFDIGDQTVLEVDGFEVVDLPSITVASYFHRGPLDHIADVYEALVSWIEDSGYQLTGRSRELYHEWDDENPERSVTELQMPIAS